MYTVLIADDDRYFIELLDRKINENTLYEVVAKLYNGQSAIEQIELLRPDIVLLDIVMPGSDGVYVVDYIRHRIEDYNPIIYILSGIGTSRILQRLNTLDIDFFSMKPVAFDVIIQNLNMIVEKQPGPVDSKAEPENIEYRDAVEAEGWKVKRLTMELGMMPHHLSTRCMNEALKYCMKNVDASYGLTKVLYPTIAKQNGITIAAVEKNIRYAIGSIQKVKTPAYKKIFAYAEDKKISNGEFLAVVSEYLAVQRA